MLHDDRHFLTDFIPEDRAVFSPRHDAESCFWVIAHFLLTALPSGADPVLDDTSTAQRVCNDIELHEVGTILDRREVIFGSSPKNRSGALHPSLRRFGKLLDSLASLVRPIYELCDPPLSIYHLHEAIQRTLLQEICDTLDACEDVSLNVEMRRALRSSFVCPSLKAPSQHWSNKRQRSDSGSDETDSRRRRLD